MKATQSTFQKHRFTIGSLLGVAGLILLFIAIPSLFADLQFTIPGVILVIVGAVVAGRRRLREFISNILP